MPAPPTDNDADGYGTVEEGGRDCDDADNDVHPGAVEICDGIDDDCDGLVDENASDAVMRYPDNDGDGYGLTQHGMTVCVLGEEVDGWAALADDCDDGDATVHPEAEEDCDGLDDDCDGLTDEAVTTVWALDADGDGYGDDDETLAACTAPGDDWSAASGDCDDGDPLTYPDAPSLCDGEDRDCDGLVDDDIDGDGWADATCGGEDCDDNDTDISPDAIDWPNGTDDDCDGAVDHTDIAKLGTYVGGAEAGFGIGGAVAIGDADGDGNDDLWLGARRADGDHTGDGGAWMLQGPLTAAADLDSAALDTWGEEDGAALGAAVLAADLDGDGTAELIAGLPGASDGGASAGAVWILAGSLTGTVSSSDASAAWSGGWEGGRAGSALAVLERDDGTWLAVGAPGADEAEVAGGAVYLVADAGDASGSLDDEAALGGTTRYGSLGTALVAGDLDGDGQHDLAAGAPDAGSVTVWLDPASATSDADADGWASGPSSAGGALATGDVDGDGYDDLLVGGSSVDDEAGAAWLLEGPVTGVLDLDADASAAYTGADATDALGTAVLLADVSGDGTLDVVLGAPGRAATGVEAGAVGIWATVSLGASSLDEADWLVSGPEAGDQLGTSLAIGGLGADGAPLLAIGAPGSDESGADAGAVWLLDGSLGLEVVE